MRRVAGDGDGDGDGERRRRGRRWNLRGEWKISDRRGNGRREARFDGGK